MHSGITLNLKGTTKVNLSYPLSSTDKTTTGFYSYLFPKYENNFSFSSWSKNNDRNIGFWTKYCLSND